MAEPDKPADSSSAEARPQPTGPSCLVLPSFLDACGLVSSCYSCLIVRTHSRHFALSPKYLNKKRSGIKEQLDSELLKYNSGLEGVPVAYDNIKIVGELGDIYDDLGYIHLTIQADFVVFQPKSGRKLVGVVNKVAPSHLGCLVHGCFNASIPKPMKMQAEVWQHIGVKIGDQMEFEVYRLDSDAVGVFCIRGRLDRKMEAEAIGRFNEMSEEQNANVPSNEADTGPENADEEVALESPVISKDRTKTESKKRTFQEILPQTVSEGEENQLETTISLEEIPKKKRKKHKHQEMLVENVSLEVDVAGGHSAMEDTIVDSPCQLLGESLNKKRKKKKHQDSVQNSDIDYINTTEVSADHICGTDGESVKTEKSKKKKRRHLSELSFQNGIADSDATENSTLEEVGAETGTVLETIQKKHKKKHKRSSTVFDPEQEPTNGGAAVAYEQSLAESFVIQQETPKLKKHKKKHNDHM
ncbi:DNA-directed RNA polymerase I subunit RPA43 [Mixophyes fleayi]|uniref:DNA-directed RNA polymerase I subunit RPA43 n=1 Tax=Mixophyes fleayi TaxID=3061075 RepID=UPI003F4D7A2B